MIQAFDVNTGTWTNWYFKPETSANFAPYTSDTTGQGAFFVNYSLNEMGVPLGDFVTKFRLVNLTSLDRMQDASGIGVVLPNDNGATSTFLPADGPGYPAHNNTYFDPDPLYFGALGAAPIATDITNVRTTVTTTPLSSVTAGTGLTYTVTFENLGSGDANLVGVSDLLDGNFTGASFTSVANGGATGNTASGAGGIPAGETLTLPADSSVVYTITGMVKATASGSIDSTFTATPPALPQTDPTPLDNVASSSLPVIVSGDLVVDLTGTTPLIAGSPVTYTAIITNNGPSEMDGVNITDSITPGVLTGVAFTSTASGGATGNTNGTGPLNDFVNLPPGASISYTITGAIPPDYTGPLDITVSTTPAAGTSDPTPADGTQTLNGTVIASGDLSVTIGAMPPTPVSGQIVTYTIVAGNSGPSTASGTLLADIFNAAFTSVTFTSPTTAGVSGNTLSGSGNINDVLTIDPGKSVTYTVTAKLADNVTGNVTNTASITPPSGFDDPDLSNNSATASVNVVPGADTGLVVTPNTPIASLGGKMSYTVDVTNTGPADATGVKIASLIDPNILGVTFTSTAFNGATGNATVGAGNLNDTVNLPAGSKITYVIGGTVATGISGNLTSTFTVTNPPGLADPDTTNNSKTVVTPTQPSANVIFAASTGLGVVTQVFVFNSDGTQRFSYQPYATAFTRGVNVAIGDVSGDGFPDVVTGAASGGGSHVHAVNGLNGDNLFSFFAYGPVVHTGVVVAVGDINGDGRPEIVTGSDAGGGPRIRVFDMTKGGAAGNSVLDFFAFDPSMNAGVRVAVGDINGDGKGEIIVSAGPGGPAMVKVFNGQTGAFISQFFPFESTSTRGVYVSAADLNGDGKADIIVGNDRGTQPLVRTFDPSQNYKQLSEFFAYETNFKGGVRVATYSDDSVSIANPPTRILTGPGPGGGPRLRKFTNDGQDLGSQFLIGSFDRGGIYVG
jgi:uncharacterized repeat protein (TIGR01451 family)